jgi:hypothetical protein
MERTQENQQPSEDPRIVQERRNGHMAKRTDEKVAQSVDAGERMDDRHLASFSRT